MTIPSGHVVLLGDSIFDNQAYVPGEPDVVAQLREELPREWSATLLAVDGDVASGVVRQLSSLPQDATHLVVSVGGNDALGFGYLLEERAGTVREALGLRPGPASPRSGRRWRSSTTSSREPRSPTAHRWST